jgi:hypothetical protein
METVTAEQVTERCAKLGFIITKPGFAQYIADICNRPLTIPMKPPPVSSDTLTSWFWK